MTSAANPATAAEVQRERLSEFYKQNFGRFYALAYSKLHNFQTAEDAIQEAFLRIARNPDNFFKIPPDKQTAYVDVVIKNICIDMFRAQCRSATVELTDELSDIGAEGSAEENYISTFSERELLKFIRSMPQQQREVLELRVMEGLSGKEIAQRLGVSEVCVRQRLFRARKAIAQHLDIG